MRRISCVIFLSALCISARAQFFRPKFYFQFEYNQDTLLPISCLKIPWKYNAFSTTSDSLVIFETDSNLIFFIDKNPSHITSNGTVARVLLKAESNRKFCIVEYNRMGMDTSTVYTYDFIMVKKDNFYSNPDFLYVKKNTLHLLRNGIKVRLQFKDFTRYGGQFRFSVNFTRRTSIQIYKDT